MESWWRKKECSYFGKWSQTLLFDIPDQVMSIELEALVNVKIRNMDSNENSASALVLLSSNTRTLTVTHFYSESRRDSIFLPSRFLFSFHFSFSEIFSPQQKFSLCLFSSSPFSRLRGSGHRRLRSLPGTKTKQTLSYY